MWSRFGVNENGKPTFDGDEIADTVENTVSRTEFDESFSNLDEKVAGLATKNELASKISTVNGVAPDANGNVVISGGGTGNGIVTRDVTTGESFTIGSGAPPANTAPVLSSSFNLAATDDLTAVSIPYTITDNGAGFLTVVQSIDGVNTSVSLSKGANTWNVGLLAVGTHTLTLKATDSEGLASNTLSFTIAVTAQSSNAAPVISSSYTPGAIDDQTSVSIPYTVTDDKTASLTLTKTIDGVTTTATISKGANTWVVGTLAAGTHTLTLKVTDSEGLQSNTLTFTITATAQVVNKAVTGVTLNASTLNINKNTTSQLTATVAPADATNKAVTWSSSNPAVATVNSSGLVTGVTEGNAIITATTIDGGFTATCSYTIIVTNFDGTQNAYINGSYMYVNPETILDADIALRPEGEPSHIYFSMSPTLTKVNLALSAATESNAANVFNGVIPYAGAQPLSNFTSGTVDCPDVCYITNQNTVYLRIPASLYASNSNKIQLALFSISNRLPILNGPANETVVITDAIIDAIPSLSTITVVNGMHSGFANLSAGLGANTSITAGVNSICGRYISTTDTKETWYVNATTRLNFKIPQSKMPTCNLVNVKQYLKDNRLTFWIAK
ncbi:Ig-like domain-containing protein [Peribacillus sp. Aquil_B1]|uniref:Ig-like domain-containing protein n=1 Tax=Peribacillus sp. Aquil_B1 TaxID=3019285 RepID=UPI003FA7ACCD